MVLLTLIYGGVSYAQVKASSSTYGEFETIVYDQNRVLLECDFTEPGNSFEDGIGSTNGDFEFADEFIIAADETFTIERATFNMVTDGGEYSDITIRFYDNSGGLPGNLISETVAVPVSQEIIGAAFGADARAVVVNFETPIVLEGTSGEETIYWVSIFTPNGSGALSFVEITNNPAFTDSTISYAFFDTSFPDDGWLNMFSSGASTELALVFSLEGQCDELLSINDQLISQVSVYPNPASSLVNIQVPDFIKINKARVYDVLGKDTSIDIVNDVIDVSKLSKGLYLVQIETTAGIILKKIVKN